MEELVDRLADMFCNYCGGGLSEEESELCESGKCFLMSKITKILEDYDVQLKADNLYIQLKEKS